MYNRYYYLSILGLNLIHVSKGAPGGITYCQSHVIAAMFYRESDVLARGYGNLGPDST